MDSAYTPAPDPVVSGLNVTDDVGLLGNQWDYGWRVSFDVTNHGSAGNLRITAWLSSSEGEWERVQNVGLGSGESRRFTYFFDEPTINANNIYGGARLSP